MTANAPVGFHSLEFLSAGGEMGRLMRSHDWPGSPLGPPADWPQSLRLAVRLMLNTGHPMYIWWGAEHACLYNDAYRESIGPERHPGSLGRPAREVWDEIWDIVGPQIEQVMAGRGATWNVDHLVPITRHGRREDVYWTYSYSPIDDETAPGGIGGVLVVCTETTRHVETTRRLAAERDRLSQLFEQAPTFMALLRGAEHRFEFANPGYLRLVGDRPVVGKTVAEALPEAVEQGFVALLDEVYATGRAFAGKAAKFSFQPAPGQPVAERFVDFVYQPIKDADGRVTGIFVEGADITERALSDASLRESEARFRAALNAGQMGWWETDHVTRTRHWSEEGMALFGLSLPGGVGQLDGEDDEYARALHPDDRHLVARFRELSARQDSFPAEYRIVRPDGRVLWLSGRGLVVSRAADGRALRLVSIMADATERKLAEEQLRRERERLGLALNAGRMGAYDMTLEDEGLWWSPETYALFGVDPEAFVPSPESILARIHPDDRDAFAVRRAEAIERRTPFEHEFRVLRPDGTEAWLGHRGHAEYDDEGRAVRTFGVTMDITERKRAEQLLREADTKKDNFIAILAHELRNPLAPIRNALHVLRQSGNANPTDLRCHDIIERQVGQMAHLLDDLLDVSRLSRGQLQLRRRPLNLATAIEQAVEIAQPIIDAAGHTFVLNLPPERIELEGDLTRLAQIFSNVLINAAKYTPPGGHIALSLQRESGAAVIRVADTGIGIAAEHVARIFEIFGQVESAQERSQGGQGIGLSLTRGLVEMHGGTIDARSEGEGKGSEFVIVLPVSNRPGEAAASTVLDAIATTVGPVSYRILIADDAPDAADTMALLLEFAGHVVKVAYDGEAALLLAETWRPEVALLDLGMPKVDGVEVCRRLRATPWGRTILLIAQTGWGQEGDRRRTREAGFDHHVVKPVEPEVVLGLLADAKKA